MRLIFAIAFVLILHATASAQTGTRVSVQPASWLQTFQGERQCENGFD